MNNNDLLIRRSRVRSPLGSYSYDDAAAGVGGEVGGPDAAALWRALLARGTVYPDEDGAVVFVAQLFGSESDVARGWGDDGAYTGTRAEALVVRALADDMAPRRPVSFAEFNAAVTRDIADGLGLSFDPDAPGTIRRVGPHPRRVRTSRASAAWRVLAHYAVAGVVLAGVLALCGLSVALLARLGELILAASAARLAVWS